MPNLLALLSAGRTMTLVRMKTSAWASANPAKVKLVLYNVRQESREAT